MNLQAIVKLLAKHLKADDFKIDIDGIFRTELDRGLKIELFINDDGDLVIQGVVKEKLAHTPAGAEELKKYLKMNFARFHKQEDVLTLDPTREWLILYRKVPEKDLRDNIVVENIEKFLNNLDLWYSSLQSDHKPSETKAMHSQPFFLTP